MKFKWKECHFSAVVLVIVCTKSNGIFV